MSHPHDSKFAAIQLCRYTNASFGIAFSAPATWQDTSGEFFQITDNGTHTQFTANAYHNKNALSPEAWANARCAMVVKGMPFLRQVKGLYQLNGRYGSAFAAEYSGVYPTSHSENRYLVLCLHTEEKLISFTITSPESQFAKHEALYRWLLETQLSLFSNLSVNPSSIIPKLQPASSASVAHRVRNGGCPPAADSEALLYQHLLGDLVVSYTIPGAPADASMPVAVLKAAGLDTATVHGTSLENLYRTVHGQLKFSQMTLTPPEQEKASLFKRMFSSAPAPIPAYFSIETGNNLEASCILLAPIWESVASMVKGDLRIVIPRQNTCLFCGADDPWLPMMTGIAEDLRTERLDLALSACVFGYSGGSIGPVGKLTEF